MTHQLRMVLAVLASSVWVPLICYFGVIAPDMARQKSFGSEMSGRLFTIGFFAVGWIATLIAISIVAAVMSGRIRRGDSGTLNIIMLCALALGAICLPLLWRIGWGPDSSAMRMAIAGGIGGLVSGATFCVIALTQKG
jgi:hypothetical protein